MNSTSCNYKTPLGLTSQFSFCGLPFRLDTYAGCALSCTYCFARLRGGNSNTKKIRFANPESIISKFKNALTFPKKNTGVISEFIRRRVPVHIGGMSDPFQPVELTKKITYKVLDYLCSINYPIILSTKSILVSRSEYINLLSKNPNVVIQFSFSTVKDSISDILEPYAYNPSEILRSVEVLSKNNINTTIRWQPYVPMVSDSPSSFVKTVSSTGALHIGFEHLKLPIESNNPLWDKLTSKMHFNLREFYSQNECTYDGRELVLPAEAKIKIALQVKDYCHKFGISFGAADNDLQYLSDSNCCCSGADLFSGFENWTKFQIGHAVKKSNGDNISIDLIRNEWRPNGSVDQFLNSKSRIAKSTEHNKLEDYIIDRWQNLDSPFNPTKFHGVMYHGLKDDNGLRVYEWEKQVKNLVWNS